MIRGGQYVGRTRIGLLRGGKLAALEQSGVLQGVVAGNYASVPSRKHT